MYHLPRLHSLPLVTIVFALVIPTATAQIQSGNIHGTVLFEDGDPLPGVTVELEGTGTLGQRITDIGGNFHFPGLAPGTYNLSASLHGFSTVIRERVDVRVGRNTTIDLIMVPEIEETIIVTAEAPLLDERKISSGASVTQVELSSIPTARDPWVVLQTVPGVLTDDVNVGGSRGGRQHVFTGTGSNYWNNTYALDGVVITDVWGGASSSYFDFDSFEEMQVSTGGSDVSRATGGVMLNLVTRRGTNQWRSSARYVLADERWQSRFDPDPDNLAEGQTAFYQYSGIDRIEDYGIEGGGPLLNDRLWAWAHYGRNDINTLTTLDFKGGKINTQFSKNTSAVLFFDDNSKSVDLRGLSSSRTEPASWDQRGNAKILKIEGTRIFGSDLFVTGIASWVDQAFSFTPRGGVAGPNAVFDSDFVWQNNYLYYETERPQRQVRLDASYYFSTSRVSHEIEASAGYRVQDTTELWVWPGDVVRLDLGALYGYPYNIAQVSRKQPYAYSTEFTTAHLQDTVLFGRVTANFGLRLDRQQGSLGSATAPGVQGFESLPDGTPLLPEVVFQGREQDFTWNDISPRLGLTVGLGEDRDTLLRASYARFADQLDQFFTTVEWPIGPSYAYFLYEDSDENERVTVDEIIGFEQGPLWTNGYDPLGQTALYDIDPGFEAPLTDELILALEHAVLPEFVIGLNLTWRDQTRFYEQDRLVEENGVVRPHRRSDYELVENVEVTLPDGTTSVAPTYGLRDGIVETGRFRINKGKRGSEYLGASIHADKRLSKHWMLRGHVSWSEWTWNVPEETLEDPNLSPLWGEPGWNDDGGTVMMYGITQGWSYRIGGLLEVAPEKRWAFDLAGNIWGRQGYALPYSIQVRPFEREGVTEIQATGDVADFRLPDVHLVDLRIDKDFTWGNSTATIGIECFNVMNQQTVLKRNTLLEGSRKNFVDRVIDPRVFRLYTKISFN